MKNLWNVNSLKKILIITILVNISEDIKENVEMDDYSIFKKLSNAALDCYRENPSLTEYEKGRCDVWSYIITLVDELEKENENEEN